MRPLIILSRRCYDPCLRSVNCSWPFLAGQGYRHFSASQPASLWSNQVSEEARQASPVQGHEKELFNGSESSESKLFALGSSLATRLSTDREIECTEFDDKGEIVIGHGHIKKSDLVKKVRHNFAMRKDRC